MVVFHGDFMFFCSQFSLVHHGECENPRSNDGFMMIEKGGCSNGDLMGFTRPGKRTNILRTGKIHHAI